MYLRLLVSNQINSYVAAISSSTTAAMADTAINTVTAAGAGPSLLHDVILSKFSSNPLAVGAAWMVSSAIFTTYSTTKFIKYKKPTTTIPISDEQQHPFWVQQQRLLDRLRPLKNRLHQYNAMANQRSEVNWPSNSRHKKPNNIQPRDVTAYNQLSERRPQSESVLVGGDPSRTLSPSSLLTMYRFAGSLLFGLLFSTSSTLQQRFHYTITTIPTLLIPSICLFIANFSNTYVFFTLDASIMTLSLQLSLLTHFSFFCQFFMQHRARPNWYWFNLYIKVWNTDYHSFINIAIRWCGCTTEYSNTFIIDSNRVWNCRCILERPDL